MFQTTNQIWSDGNSTSIQMVKMGMVDPRKTTCFHHHHHDASLLSLALNYSSSQPLYGGVVESAFALLSFKYQWLTVWCQICSRSTWSSASLETIPPKSLGCPKKSFAKKNHSKVDYSDYSSHSSMVKPLQLFGLPLTVYHPLGHLKYVTRAPLGCIPGSSSSWRPETLHRG